MRRSYQVVSDPAAEKRGLCRVIDESGNDYMYPKKLFGTLDLPAALSRRFAVATRPHIVSKIEIEQSRDGRWIAEVVELPGLMAYGSSPDEARARVQALALRAAKNLETAPLTETQRTELDRRLAAHLRARDASRPWSQVRRELKRRK